jgi:hypothetical protein
VLALNEKNYLTKLIPDHNVSSAVAARLGQIRIQSFKQ